MKTVVITGSTRGLGWELAENFRKNDFNVVISGTKEETVLSAAEKLRSVSGTGEVLGVRCNVTSSEDIEALAGAAKSKFGSVDIWINNAGVNQSAGYSWELDEKEIRSLLDVDLRGAMLGSNVAVRLMAEQGFGAIYNVEGFGSNDAFQPFLAVYGTAKRGVTYFSDALANEINDKKLNILVGKLSPGIMITDFLTSSSGGQGTVELSDKVKKVYNILGDKPDVIAEFLVKKMLKNKKNGSRIAWLTGSKAAFRFMTAGFNKRNFFD